MFPSAPIGPVAWVCFVVGLTLCIPALNRRVFQLISDAPAYAYLITIAVLSFGLSVGYVTAYLGGGPRIIDATSYLLQAKTFASGQFTFEPPGALHSFTGRFLVVTPDDKLAVLFPPGFAVLLAMGVTFGVPLLVNPLVGALVAVLTYRLGAQWFSERAGRVAGVVSTLCACLRYHSADTMSHVWTAALVLGVLVCATDQRQRPLVALAAGACAGWLFATRPVTGALCSAAGFALICARSGLLTQWKGPSAYVVGAIPGLVLWTTYQWVTTGSPWSTTQTQYYARSDWPEGCFRLGLGATIGCQFEHGDFLQTYQPRGFGMLEALQVSIRRLWQHQRDITNVPWLSLLAVLAVLKHSSAQRRSMLLLALVAAHIVSYAFFYFDGNYPGGGARLFVDVLPLEHVLLSVALVQLRLERFLPSACLLGFALWGAAEHRLLATREGGRPMFEPEVVTHAGITSGLVFVSTDHGFNLGFDPAADPHTGVQVVRLRNDGFDFATWQQLGMPPAYVYRFDTSGSTRAQAELVPFAPPNSQSFFGRSLWSPTTTGGSSIPVHNPEGLRLLPWKQHALETKLEVPVSHDDNYELRIETQTSSPSTLGVSEWLPRATAPSNHTTIQVLGPRFWGAGKTALTLRTEHETTIIRVTLVPVAKTPAGVPADP